MTRWALVFAACVGVAFSASAEPHDPPTPTAPAGNAFSALASTIHAPASETIHPKEVAAVGSNPMADRLGLNLSFQLRGRIEADAVMVAQSTASQALIGDILSGYGFRRARIGAEGSIGTSARWVAEIDFANGNFRARDLFVGLTALPGIREVRVGFFREPFSLEGSTSSRFITFMERSPLNVFDPARNWGVAGYWYPNNERMTYAIGAFRDGTNSSGFSPGDGGNWAVTTRLTGLPVYADEEGMFRLVHVGAAFSQRVPVNGVVTYAPDPQSNILSVSDSPASPFLPTVNIPASSYQLYNLQAATVNGPFSLQAEWFGTAIQQIGGGPVFLHGFYVYASYFVTGEHRGYDRKDGSFSQVSVTRPVVRTASKPATGIGAIELTARFAVANFESQNLPASNTTSFALAPQGAILYQPTFGVNWYLNNNTRIMFDYTLATPVAKGLPSLPVHVFGLRTAIYW